MDFAFNLKSKRQTHRKMGTESHGSLMGDCGRFWEKSELPVLKVTGHFLLEEGD
jgi:hypothetical protein